MIRLWLLRLKRLGLMRERRRLHMEAAGIALALEINAKDAVNTERDIDLLLEARRQRAADRRWRWLRGGAFAAGSAGG